MRATFTCDVSVGSAFAAGSFFFPLDVRLKLGTEGYSPAVLEKGGRQASKATSFVEASEDMRELAEIEISPTHLQRLSERIGKEWSELRDEDVEKFRQRRLERTYKEPPRGAAVVMLDGGRVQTRAEDAGRGDGADLLEHALALVGNLKPTAIANPPVIMASTLGITKTASPWLATVHEAPIPPPTDLAARTEISFNSGVIGQLVATPPRAVLVIQWGEVR